MPPSLMPVFAVVFEPEGLFLSVGVIGSQLSPKHPILFSFSLDNDNNHSSSTSIGTNRTSNRTTMDSGRAFKELSDDVDTLFSKLKVSDGEMSKEEKEKAHEMFRAACTKQDKFCDNLDNWFDGANKIQDKLEECEEELKKIVETEEAVAPPPPRKKHRQQLLQDRDEKDISPTSAMEVLSLERDSKKKFQNKLKGKKNKLAFLGTNPMTIVANDIHWEWYDGYGGIDNKIEDETGKWMIMVKDQYGKEEDYPCSLIEVATRTRKRG